MLYLQYFDMYTSKGMQVIPVYRNSKIPVGRDWNRNWNRIKCRDQIKTGDYNLGLLLGDLVDVEGDSPEANDMLNRMIDGLPHPMYRSARSVHHLFQSPDPELTGRRFFDIEFRGHRHQSVLPPSVHEDGVVYSWLRGTVFPAPPMPPALRDFYFNNRKTKQKPQVVQKKRETPLGCVKTQCKTCKGVELIHKKRLKLEVRAFADLQLPWMCHKCRKHDVRESCRRIRNMLEQDVGQTFKDTSKSCPSVTAAS